jgi:predicted Zn-dependent protease
LLAALLGSCSGESLQQDGGDLTRTEVEYLSGRMTEAVEREFPVIKHKLVNRYVSSLGQTMVSRNPAMPPLPYEFRVLKSSDIFVFSLPGGIIYVSLGLLRSMELEGQLAAALAHELAHQQLNHPLLQWRKKVNGNRGQKYLLDFSGDWRQSFLGEGGALAFTKGMEQEADQVAPVILYRSQFDPRLYTSYLQLLRKIEGSQPALLAQMLGLHPPLATRIEWAKKAQLRIPPLKEAGISSQSFSQIRSILKTAEKKGREKQEVE